MVEFKEAVPEEVGHAVAHASMVLLDAQVLLWVGEARQPMLGNLHYAIGGAPQGGGAKVNATTLTGNRFEGPGRSVAERLCAGEANLREINPDIVYASVSGYGDDGPYASRRSYDPIFQALTGYVSSQTNPQIPIPDLVRNAVVDKATAHQLAQGITAALLARERGAGGEHVRVAMLDAALSFFWPDGMMRHTLVGEGVENPMCPGERFQMLATSDGQLVSWMGTADQIRDGLRAVGRADLADHPSQRGREIFKEANQQARAEAMNAGLAQLTTAEAFERLVAYQVPVAQILTPPEVFEDPQIVHNGGVQNGEHPVYGKYRRARPPIRFSKAPLEETSAPALYAENTDEVLEELGYDGTDRQRLREKGVIPTPRS